MSSTRKPKFTLSALSIIRSDPCFTPKRLAFHIEKQTKIRLNQTAYILLRILEKNSLSINDLTCLSFKEVTGSHLEGIKHFIDNMLDEGLVTMSDCVAQELPDYEPRALDGIGIPITSTPYEVEMHLTSACNLRCVHCAYDAGQALAGELKLKDWQKLIAELEKLRVLKLIISGGEPFLFDRIKELLEYLSDRRIHIDILTNGTLIDADIARRLNSSNLSTTISIDGSSKRTHDSFRGMECFYRVIDGIQVLAENNAIFHLCTVLHKRNIEEIEPMVRLALRYGAHSISFLFIDPIGRAQDAHEYLLSHEEKQLLAAGIEEVSSKYENEIPVSYLDPSIPAYADLNVSALGDTICCTAGTTRIAVRSDGCVFPCVYAFVDDAFCGGNVKNLSIEDIWFSDAWEIFRGAISLSDLPLCRSCDYSNKCTLKLCRLRGYSINGDLFGVPVGCYKYTCMEA